MNEKLKWILIILLIIGIISLGVFWFVNNQRDISPKLSSSELNNVKSDVKSNEQNSEVQKENKGSSEQVIDSPDAVGFSFAIIADPHMDEQSDSMVYKQTLANIVTDKSAFVIDLGDTFMIDKLTEKSEANIRARYVLMKSYYDLLGAIPFYFVVGNHDGEAGWDSLNAKNYREEYFPEETYDKNYYSFETKDTLFIILDPYTYTKIKPNQDGWDWTLGKEQYDWLKKTLEESDAKYKFVFSHQLVGGDNQGRGGTEKANLYEWGGNNLDGSYGFDTKRQGWGKPIHQLFVDNKVDVFFHGHDHIYVKQELDGVIYQLVPQPSHPGDSINVASKYGYISGEILGGSGYMRVKITSTVATIDFVKADGSVASSYEIQ
jgi:3',5'-cyclic AMP phosphodiesterase CpdA